MLNTLHLQKRRCCTLLEYWDRKKEPLFWQNQTPLSSVPSPPQLVLFWITVPLQTPWLDDWPWSALAHDHCFFTLKFTSSFFSLHISHSLHPLKAILRSTSFFLKTSLPTQTYFSCIWTLLCVIATFDIMHPSYCFFIYCNFYYLFIQLLNNSLLSTHNLPGMFLSTENTTINKTSKEIIF